MLSLPWPGLKSLKQTYMILELFFLRDMTPASCECCPHVSPFIDTPLPNLSDKYKQMLLLLAMLYQAAVHVTLMLSDNIWEIMRE